jgi:LysM repeat protein
MNKKVFLLSVGFSLFTLFVVAQRISPEQYIAIYKDIAIKEMLRSGIPASITLAQGILESESGNSDLVGRSNNHFGIKCKSTWTGESVKHTDDAVDECFRKYNNPEESYIDHSNFLRGNQRYAFLFNLKADDYRGWAFGLKKAGYATNPRYPNILITNIERYNLQQYDNGKQEQSKDFLSMETAITMKPAAEVQKEETKEVSVVNDGKKTMFNGIKAVFASKGTSLLALATQFDVSLSKLLAYNDRKNDGLLSESQIIYLAKKNKEGKLDIYQLTNREALYDISQSLGIQLTYLAQYNGLTEDVVLNAGTKIKLKESAILGTASNQNINKDKKIVYSVQSKEGLYSIAKKHQVSVEQLKDWNNLNGENLSVGQQLIIAK